jgi:hypothetical protein
LLAPVGRSALVRQYLATYNKRRGVDPGTLERWKFVRAAARLAEPIPEERAPLLAFLRARVGRVSDG